MDVIALLLETDQFNLRQKTYSNFQLRKPQLFFSSLAERGC